MMKKSIFISEVRQALDYQSSDALKKLIIDIAKFIPRDSFEEVLALFTKEVKVILDINETDILTSVKELCASIKDGNYNLTWGYERGDYEDYWSDDETLYDNDGLGEELEPLFRAAMDCVANRKYSIAAQVMELLVGIEVPNEDYEDIGIKTIFENDLVSLDFKDVLSRYAYAILMTTKEDERVERLFQIEEMIRFNLKLEEIIAVNSDEIPDNHKFSKQWIAFLMHQDLTRYESILIDAIKYDGGTKALEEFTLTYGATYQKAYIDLIQTYMLEEKYENAVRIIQDGLVKIEGINGNRTVISDLYSEIGQKVNNPTYFKAGLEEGFYSSIDLAHFLNLYALNDKNVLANAVKYCDNYGPQRRNDYYYIHFLNGDYEFVWRACYEDKSPLGWSNSLKGEVLPLFVALLCGKAGLKPCIKKFIADNYIGDNFELFAQILGNSLREIPPEEYTIYFNWCAKETEERVKAIVGGQHRGSYYKASALIVSMGEALISQGNNDDAIKFIKGYKEKYPRHSAFHRCLGEDLQVSRIGNILR